MIAHQIDTTVADIGTVEPISLDDDESECRDKLLHAVLLHRFEIE